MNKIIATPHDLRQLKLKELLEHKDMCLECSGALALVYSHFTAFIDAERAGINSRDQLTYMNAAIDIFVDAVRVLPAYERRSLYGYGQAAALRMRNELMLEYRHGGKMTDEDRDTALFFIDELFKECVDGTKGAMG